MKYFLFHSRGIQLWVLVCNSTITANFSETTDTGASTKPIWLDKMNIVLSVDGNWYVRFTSQRCRNVYTDPVCRLILLPVDTTAITPTAQLALFYAWSTHSNPHYWQNNSAWFYPDLLTIILSSNTRLAVLGNLDKTHLAKLSIWHFFCLSNNVFTLQTLIASC